MPDISLSAIKDNHSRGAVGDFLKDQIQPCSNLSIVSAYFTIYAYSNLRTQLDQIDHLNFLFGEPTFIKAIDPTKTNRRDFKIEDDKLVIPLESQLKQKSVAKDCYDWIGSSPFLVEIQERLLCCFRQPLPPLDRPSSFSVLFLAAMHV